MTADLATLLAAAVPSDLLPKRRAAEAAAIATPLRLLGSASLGDQRAYLLVVDAGGTTYGVPAMVESRRLLRAAAGQGASAAVVGALVSGRGDLGGLELEGFYARPAAGERAITVDQTNELVAVGGQAVVKWFLHPTAGTQPAALRLAALEKAGFAGTPRTWALVYLPVDGERVLVATVSEYVPDAQDGWDWAVDEVRALARGLPSDAVASLRAVGDLVGRMHAALADAGVGRAEEADARHWLARARSDAVAAGLDPEVATAVDARIAPLGECAGTPTMYVHGDLHIGQVLRAGTPARFYVIDFDGNPTQTMEERLERQPAARDIASMLASIDHVGRVVLHRTDGLDAQERSRVLAWIEEAQEAFLDSYSAALVLRGHAGLLDRSLLEPMQVQQECREYAYAARYLPHWRYVPDAALPALLARAERAGSEKP